MDKFISVGRLLLASWIAKLLGWSGASLATVGVTLSVAPGAPLHIADIVIGLIGMTVHSIVDHLTMKSGINGTVAPRTLPPGVKAALIALLFVPLFALSGCSRTLSAQFDSPPAAAPLSANDQKAVILASNIRATLPETSCAHHPTDDSDTLGIPNRPALRRQPREWHFRCQWHHALQFQQFLDTVTW